QRAPHRGPEPAEEGGPVRGPRVLPPGDRVRNAVRGDGEGDGPPRKRRGAPRRGRGPEPAAPRDGGPYGGGPGSEDVRAPGGAVHRQRRDDRVDGPLDAPRGSADVPRGHRGGPEIPYGRSRRRVAVIPVTRDS